MWLVHTEFFNRRLGNAGGGWLRSARTWILNQELLFNWTDQAIYVKIQGLNPNIVYCDK